MPIRKFFLDIYFDDFGTYRNVYHTLGGVYLQFGNMPFRLRKQLKNHFLLGFVPFGGDVYEFFGLLRNEIKSLERGIMIGNYWVIGGIGGVLLQIFRRETIWQVSKDTVQILVVVLALYTKIN